MLQFLRHLIQTWSQRRLGRCLGVTLLLALVMAGLPIGEIHSHAGGNYDHEHDDRHAAVQDVATVVDQALASDLAGDKVFHVHDPVTNLSVLLGPVLDIPLPMYGMRQWSVMPVTPPPSTTHRPPYRPPIA